jgi:hypothetical protein
MLQKQLIVIFLLILATPLFAEMYKCDVKDTTYYSSTPCDNQALNLEIGEQSIEDELLELEKLILPNYPGWSNG